MLHFFLTAEPFDLAWFVLRCVNTVLVVALSVVLYIFVRRLMRALTRLEASLLNGNGKPTQK